MHLCLGLKVLDAMKFIILKVVNKQCQGLCTRKDPSVLRVTTNQTKVGKKNKVYFSLCYYLHTFQSSCRNILIIVASCPLNYKQT